jgi:hypothetical protein
MATLKRKIQVEQTMRELLERNGLPEPDSVEYGYESVRLFFNEPKVCLIIDIDEQSDDYGVGSAEIEEAAGNAELN